MGKKIDFIANKILHKINVTMSCLNTAYIYLKDNFILFLWYLFIVIFIGQISTLYYLLAPILSADRGVLLNLLNLQIQKGSYLTFSIILICNSLFFMIVEYTKNNAIENRKWKSLLLLVSIALIVLSLMFLSESKQVLNRGYTTLHWGLYFSSILLSIVLWKMADEEPAKKYIADIDKSADEITKQSKDNNKVMENGVVL